MVDLWCRKIVGLKNLSRREIRAEGYLSPHRVLLALEWEYWLCVDCDFAPGADRGRILSEF